MIDEFWRAYNQSLFAYYYHKLERDSLKFRMKLIGIASYVVTAISLAGWGITVSYAVVWSVVIFACQLLHGLKDFLEYPKRVWSTETYMQYAAAIDLDMAKTWRDICMGHLTEDEIRENINTYEARLKEISIQYINPYSLKDNQGLITKANEMTDMELASRHGSGVVFYEETSTPR